MLKFGIRKIGCLMSRTRYLFIHIRKVFILSVQCVVLVVTQRRESRLRLGDQQVSSESRTHSENLELLFGKALWRERTGKKIVKLQRVQPILKQKELFSNADLKSNIEDVEAERSSIWSNAGEWRWRLFGSTFIQEKPCFDKLWVCNLIHDFLS